MEYFLLQAFALFRPMMFIDTALEIGGFSLFELAGIALFSALVFAFLYRAAVVQSIAISSVDTWIMAFVGWCIAAFLVHYEDSSIKALAGLVFPPLTYIIAKNFLNRERYVRILMLLLTGFVVPLAMSAALIASGTGVEYVSYWTGIPRYKGAYSNSHNFGHSMTLLLMVMMAYLAMRWRSEQSNRNKINVFRLGILLAPIAATAVYCAYMAAVRTAVVGFLVFLGVYLYSYSRKLFMTVAIMLSLATVAFSSVLVPVFLADVEKISAGEWGVEQMGSGRFAIWQGKLTAFSELPLDRLIAGIGLGNRMQQLGSTSDYAPGLDSHSDYLEIMVTTGVVGLALVLILYLVLFRQIMRMQGWEKYLLLAVFLAVIIMNFLSNSYIARYGLGQIFFLMMTYAELPGRSEARRVATEYS